MLSDDETKKILLWKRKLEEVGRSGAIIVLTKDNDDIFAFGAKYLPFFMKKNSYVSLLLVSDDEERVNRFKTNIDFSVGTAVVFTDI